MKYCCASYFIKTLSLCLLWCIIVVQLLKAAAFLNEAKWQSNKFMLRFHQQKARMHVIKTSTHVPAYHVSRKCTRVSVNKISNDNITSQAALNSFHFFSPQHLLPMSTIVLSFVIMKKSSISLQNILFIFHNIYIKCQKKIWFRNSCDLLSTIVNQES